MLRVPCTGGMVQALVGLPSASAKLLWVSLQRAPAVNHKTFCLLSASTSCVWYRLVTWIQTPAGSDWTSGLNAVAASKHDQG